MKKIKFGYTGYSSFFPDTGRKISTGFYTFSEYLGAVIVTIVATQIKWPSYYSWDLDFTKQGWILFFTHPYFWGVIGLLAVWYGRSNKGADLANLKITNEGLVTDLTDLKNENVKALDELQQKLDKSDKKVRKLTENLVEATQDYSILHSKFLRNWLKLICYAMKADHNQFRVTIFVYNQGSFVYLSRYSSNPTFDEMHSVSFEKNNGVISKAWELGEWVDLDIPPFDEKSPQAYYAHMFEKYKFDKNKVDNLTMKSFQYIALSIRGDTVPLGVIVFENCDLKNKITTQKVGQLKDICSKHQPQLIAYIKEGLKCDTIGHTKAFNGKPTKDIELDILESLKSAEGLYE
ncbi:hypothetical protein H0920_08395 [Acinetobacter sp. C_4_1]|uniref:hypothetical protein n=1 Tax=unclassified Acinetobacter TaxID=196816 RepID=UPI0021B7EB61|nr:MULTISPECIES: hypothetical protein [unclassified Acinetobacter]MCT8089429.1 hypothetical protein [Acinetobacter sp. F_3_1]MCT8098203.1 hypothetical protein [Acinetobacter sp. C_3_1]MCT8101119.1 hypothetical protein [Acinetobacter sp. C_4_1]MCT8134870.1 hypothetical protein [Acinetobacter sp. T_3_1]